MGIIDVGNAGLCFDSIDGLLEHGALDGGNMMEEAKRLADKAGQVDNGAIVRPLYHSRI
jgi:hypothetical protein